MSEGNALDVLIGAGSGIGGALIERWQSVGQRPVLAVARSRETLSRFYGLQRVICEETDYSDEQLMHLADTLLDRQEELAR